MEEEREELDVQETRRLIRPDSYDDNWQLVNYTSELRDNNGNFYAYVDFNADGIGEIKNCPHCLEYGFKNKLGPKIKKKGELIAPDDDQFMSCYECGNTFPIYETFAESKIKDSLETVDNPFENESIFLSVESRATQRRKGKKPRNKRLKTEEHEDPEIQAEINKGNTVRILQDI